MSIAKRILEAVKLAEKSSSAKQFTIDVNIPPKKVPLFKKALDALLKKHTDKDFDLKEFERPPLKDGTVVDTIYKFRLDIDKKDLAAIDKELNSLMLKHAGKGNFEGGLTESFNESAEDQEAAIIRVGKIIQDALKKAGVKFEGSGANSKSKLGGPDRMGIRIKDKETGIKIAFTND